MCESYARSLMRVAVAQLCQALGWDAVQLSACELLSDVLERYLQQLARGCHRYSELCESLYLLLISISRRVHTLIHAHTRLNPCPGCVFTSLA